MISTGAPASPVVRPLLFFEERLRATLPASDCLWTPLAYGVDQLPLCAVSLALGGHVRVGIGDCTASSASPRTQRGWSAWRSSRGRWDASPPLPTRPDD